MKTNEKESRKKKRKKETNIYQSANHGSLNIYDSQLHYSERDDLTFS
jgi:hypothetical protein